MGESAVIVKPEVAVMLRARRDIAVLSVILSAVCVSVCLSVCLSVCTLSCHCASATAQTRSAAAVAACCDDSGDALHHAVTNYKYY